MAHSSSSKAATEFLQFQQAVSVWNDEGGACSTNVQNDTPELTNAELVQLRVRVIALENLLTTLLAEGSERQLEVAREMASYISPRAGSTQHPLTIRAADHMIDMVNRAEHFRTTPSS